MQVAILWQLWGQGHSLTGSELGNLQGPVLGYDCLQGSAAVVLGPADLLYIAVSYILHNRLAQAGGPPHAPPSSVLLQQEGTSVSALRWG